MSVPERVAVLSDVHGNLPALEAVLSDIHARGAFDSIVAAGDHCLNGPDPAAALDLVLSECTVALKGNTDRDIVDEGASDPDLGNRKRSSIGWTREQLGPDRIRALDALVFDYVVTASDGATLRVVHANPHDLDRHIFPDMDDDALARLLAPVTDGMLVFGHLHIPFTRWLGALRLVNIAACGLPRDGDRRATWGEFRWRRGSGWSSVTYRVPYDFGQTALRMIDSSMPDTERRIRDLLRARYD